MPADHETVIADLKAEVRSFCRPTRFAALKGMPFSLVWLPLLLLLLRPAPADAQLLRHRVGLSPGIGLHIGAGDILDSGFGIDATGGVRMGDSPVWIRADAGFMSLTATTPTPGGPTSDNTLLKLTVGPEVEGRLGIVRPFLHGLAGYVLNVPGGDVSTADTNGSGVLGTGAGLRFRLSSSPRPALLEAEIRLTRSGELSFARVDDSVDTEVTSIELRLGVLLGLP